MTKLKLEYECPKAWDSMRPEGSGRHCSACDRIVHDVCSLTSDELASVMRREERPCLRAALLPDGTAITRELLPAARKFVRSAVAVSALGSTLACNPSPPSGTKALEREEASPVESETSGSDDPIDAERLEALRALLGYFVEDA